MDIIKCLLYNNDCYKRGATIRPKGVMVHSTGCYNTSIKRYVQPAESDPNYNELMQIIGKNKYNNDWNNPGLKVCVHGFIGTLADGSVGVVQTLPWNRRGWHCGSGRNGSGNNDYISFEICEDKLQDRNYFEKVYKKAVELTAYLCKEYGFNPLGKNVVICHSEGCRLGIASNHGDVEHWFPRFGKSMDDFRHDVKKVLDGGKKPNPEPQPETGGVIKKMELFYQTYNDVPEWYQKAIKKLMDMGALKGTDNKGTIDVSETLCRIMTMLDRMGKI